MRTHYAAQLSPRRENERVEVSGWVKDLRILGNIAFINLRDRTGHLQLTFRKKDNADLFKKLGELTKESVISVKGKVEKNDEAPRGFEVIPHELKILSKANTPLPMDISGKIRSELETRLNVRFMDLRNPKNAAVFSIRDSLLTGMRDFLDDRDFVEVQTPKIVSAAAEGGSTLFPVNYFNEKAYLSQSPQLFKQVLMATEFDRVYEIAPAFRAEKSDTTRHLSEFTSFDFEMSFVESMEDVLQMTEEMVAYSFQHLKKNVQEELDLLEVEMKVPDTPFKRITFDQVRKLLNRKGVKVGDDLDTKSEKVLGEVMEEQGHEFYFITDFPEQTKPFYIMRGENAESESFDLDYRGEELASGGQREHRYDQLVENIKKQGLKPKDFEFYLKAFQYGIPPHGGMGMGVERILHKLLGLSNVREATLFPRDRYRLVP